MLKGMSKGFKFLLAAELLVLLVVFSGCFRKAEQILDLRGEELECLAGTEETRQTFESSRFSLVPGVYQVRVITDLSESQLMYVEVKSEIASFGALEGNGVNIFPNKDCMEFSVYVKDTLPAAYIYCEFENAPSDSLEQLEIYRTNKANRMLLLILTVLFLMLDFLIVFRRKILEGEIDGKRQVVFWSLTAAVLLAYFPYLMDCFSMGMDTLFHLTRMAGLADTLRQGTSFPIRVQSYWCYDHGYAVSLFYGDLFLFVPAMLLLAGFPLMYAYKTFILLILAVTAALTYFSFNRCVKSEYGALCGSVLYLFNPYYLFNIYSRGALGEVQAMMFFPLVGCGMYLLYAKEVSSGSYRYYKWYIILGLSAILQSHILTAEMTVMTMAVLCAVFWRRTFRKETLLQLLEATVTVMVLNAWFWVPLIYMMVTDRYRLQGIVSGAIQENGLSFATLWQWLPNMGDVRASMWNCGPMQIGAGGLMLLLLFLLWRKSAKRTAECWCLAVLGFAAMIMSTKYFPWDGLGRLPLLGQLVTSLQFPFRWMVPADLFVSLFAAFFYCRVRDEGGILMKTGFGIAMLLVLGTAVYHVNSIAFEASPAFLYEANNMGTINVSSGEYLLEEAGEAKDMYYHDPVSDIGLEWSDYSQKGTNAVFFVNNTQEEELYVEIPLMGYKGYAVEPVEAPAGNELKEGEGLPYITEQRGRHGDLRIAVPGGYKGTLSVSYQGLPVFHWAEAVSAAGLAVLFCAYGLGKARKLRKKK